MEHHKLNRNISILVGLISALLCLTISKPSPIQAQTGVTMRIDPTVTQIEVGDTFGIDVVVDAGSQLVNAAQALIEFEPAVLQVELVSGDTTLPVTLVNTTDNNAGTVTFSAGIFGDTVTGSFTLLRIEFMAIGTSPGTTIDLNTDSQQITRTRVNDPGGNDVLNNTIPGSVVAQSSNEAPVADAGLDQAVTDSDNSGAESVTLDGSGSGDIDGTIISYEWSEGGDLIESGVSPTVAFSLGSHTVTLTVTDDDGATDTDEVIITVNEPDNQAPVADAGPDQTVTDSDNNGAESVTLDGSGSTDNDGSIVSYEWSENGTVLATGQNPVVDFTLGVHTVTLTITDNDGAVGTDTVTITINQPPVADAGPDRIVTDSNNSGAESVTLDGSGSTDNDGSIVSYEWSENGVALATGQTPTLNFDVGSHTVTLTVTDNHGGTGTDTVNITVEPLTTQDDVFFVIEPAVSTVAVGEDFSVTVQVVAGSQQVDGAEAHLDFDPALLQVKTLTPGSTLSTGILNGFDNNVGEIDYAAGVLPPTPPASGTFDLVTIEFEALAETSGTDLTFGFTFPRETKATFQGASILSDVSEGSVVIELNEAPVADDQLVEVDEDDTVNITLTASDNENDSLIYEVIDQPQYGLLSGATPDLIYTPNPDYNGPDSFTFKANDGNSDSNVATVSIMVHPVNDEPLAEDDQAVTVEDTQVVIDVLNNDSDADGDTLIVVSVTQPASGTATINIDQTVNYAPDDDFCGSDSFNYTISDGHGSTATATVSVEVTCQNDDPLAEDDEAITDANTPINIEVLTNDSDVDGDSLSVVSVTQPGHGTASINFDHTVRYTPDTGFNGSDSFNYTISDGHGSVATATVNVTVNKVPEAIILGSVDLQGRPATPHARWSVPLTVNLYQVGAATPAYEFTPTTDDHGAFNINAEITPGTYEIAIKHFHTLQNVVTVELLDGDNTIDFGTLLEGDADNNNRVTLLDFSILSTVFNTTESDIDFDPRADFNEDGVISLLDFSLLSTNFNISGRDLSGLQLRHLDKLPSEY